MEFGSPAVSRDLPSFARIGSGYDTGRSDRIRVNELLGVLQAPNVPVTTQAADDELDLRTALGKRFEMALQQTPAASHKPQSQHASAVHQTQRNGHLDGHVAPSSRILTQPGPNTQHHDGNIHGAAAPTSGAPINPQAHQDRNFLFTPALGVPASTTVGREQSQSHAQTGDPAASTAGDGAHHRTSNTSGELFGQPAAEQHAPGTASYPVTTNCTLDGLRKHRYATGTCKPLTQQNRTTWCIRARVSFTVLWNMW